MEENKVEKVEEEKVETKEEVKEEIPSDTSKDSTSETSSENTENTQLIENVKPKSKAVKIIKWVFSGIGLAILSFLIVVVGWLTIDKYIVKSPVPSFAGYSHLIVTTGSMSGTIEEGDLIIIKETNDYKGTDIVTYIREGEKVPTTHRILFVYETEDGTYYETKGDANPSSDIELVHESDVCGEVVLVIENFGIFLSWIKDGGGLIYLIAIIAIVAAGVYVIKRT